jgi:cytochrome c peroxidase
VTGDTADRYRFRTTPLRNVALQPAFFHNGAYTTLEEVVAPLSALAPVKRLAPNLDVGSWHVVSAAGEGDRE